MAAELPSTLLPISTILVIIAPIMDCGNIFDANISIEDGSGAGNNGLRITKLKHKDIK